VALDSLRVNKSCSPEGAFWSRQSASLKRCPDTKSLANEDAARCPRFAPVLWALTWAPPYSGGHVRCAPRTLRRRGFHTAKNRCVPNFFHHIFPVRSSQTCTTIAETIYR
jgi:hypothetical protein